MIVLSSIAHPVPVVRMAESIEHAPSSLEEILRTALVHERKAVDRYRAVLEAAEGDIALEEFARGMVAAETDHAAAMEKMLRTMG